MIYIVYKDDGPNGFTGQGYSTTGPWTKLMIVPESGFNKLRHQIESIRFRKNPRIAELFSDSADSSFFPVENWVGEWVGD